MYIYDLKKFFINLLYFFIFVYSFFYNLFFIIIIMFFILLFQFSKIISSQYKLFVFLFAFYRSHLKR